MPLPTAPIPTANLDQGSDNPSLARADLYALAVAINQMIDSLGNADGIATLNDDGQILDSQVDTAHLLPIAGGTMTGPLNLDYEPTQNAHAVNQAWFLDWQANQRAELSTCFFRFSQYADGTAFTEASAGDTLYVGFAAGEGDAPAAKEDYRWARIKGETGLQGSTGPQGYTGPQGTPCDHDHDSGGGGNAPDNR